MPHPKRRVRASRGRGPKRGFKRGRRQGRKQAWYLVLLLVPLAFIIVVAQVCKRAPKPKPTTAAKPSGGAKSPNQRTPEAATADASQVAVRYGNLIARAGGDGVWVKRAAQVRPSPAAGEVVALAPAAQAIISALEHQTGNDGLEIRVQPAGEEVGSQPARSITLWRGSQPICSWRLREVPRLYRAAIVIDDLGQDLKPARALLSMPYALTFSILPDLTASRATALEAHEASREVMLHLPMEAFGPATISPGEGAIRVGMGEQELERVIEADLDSVPYAAGVNNHMGSRATSDAALMSEVMKELGSRRLYFIDSRTAASTVALDAARRAGIPAFYRSVFLDDTETADYTLGQLRRFRAAVEAQGVALAIGHPHPTTIRALEAFLPEFAQEDIELVPASRLVQFPEAARLSPPRVPAKIHGD
ncbi:MAG TPA: divergent polysaccharide deacetylase family protein [Terriglobia bacterium]